MDLADVMREYEQRPHHPLYPEAVSFPPKKKYLIAFTPRSGSTLLAQHLSRQLHLGYPGEYLNEGFIANFEHLFPPPSLDDFENFVLSNFTSPIGVFGMKADWWRFRRAREIGYLTRLFDDIDLMIFLKREDLVGQAVSLSLSMQTNVWHDSNIRFSDPEEVYAGVKYDAEQIIEAMISLLEQEYRWVEYLAAGDTPSMTLIYEEAVLDLDAVGARIAGELGAPFAAAEHEDAPSMKRVPSGVNSDWKERFTQERPDLVQAATQQRGDFSPVIEQWPRKLQEGLPLDSPILQPRARGRRWWR